VFEDRRISGTVLNDSEYIYIRIQTTSVEMQRLLLRGGITWWFDSKGGGKKSFGIHYPLPPPTARPEDEGDGIPPQAERLGALRVPAELELFTGEKDHQRMSILAAGGIGAKTYRQSDTLVCELTVPLSSDAAHPIGIGVSPGAVMGLGAVTTKPGEMLDLPIERAGGEGEPEAGYGGRRSGGAGGRAQARSRPDAGLRTEQLNLWMKVRLATGP
jgi:hypothetical protein